MDDLINKNLCDSCITKGCIFQSGIVRNHCDFYKEQNKMFYKITFEANTTYYLDKNLYTEQQALNLAEDWFDDFIPNVYIEEVEEEGE